MQFTENQVIEILKKVVHPNTGKDIVSMELVKDLKVKEKSIAFTLTFPTFNDPLKSSLKKASLQALQSQLGEDISIDIELSSAVKITPKKQREILPGVKNIVAVASGKGGVGKSTVAANLAVAFAQAGFNTGLIDADIFGPSIPKMLDAEKERPFVKKVDDKDMIIPVERYGVKILSIGFFVDPADATVWRGPMASNALKQLMTDALWGDLDYMFIDLPPGTSDIHLTLVQSVPVTGAVIVSTPQAVALADVIKGINMFRNKNINVPVLGLIENMAWFTPDELPDKKYYIFGKDGCKNLARDYDLPLLGQIPIVESIRESGDTGKPSVLVKNSVSEAFKHIAENLNLQVIKRNADINPTEKVEITKTRKDFIKHNKM
ncbi:MAG: Mrp/NBP35 family ATP-binding protein [Bacteroidales bacterium]|nr:Mrp/NBP35 family ATP-binding protein [Bacteroidales bacterium]